MDNRERVAAYASYMPESECQLKRGRLNSSLFAPSAAPRTEVVMVLNFFRMGTLGFVLANRQHSSMPGDTLNCH